MTINQTSERSKILAEHKAKTASLARQVQGIKAQSQAVASASVLPTPPALLVPAHELPKRRRGGLLIPQTDDWETQVSPPMFPAPQVQSEALTHARAQAKRRRELIAVKDKAREPVTAGTSPMTTLALEPRAKSPRQSGSPQRVLSATGARFLAHPVVRDEVL